MINEKGKEQPSFLRARDLGVFRLLGGANRKALSTVLLRERAKNRKRATQPPKVNFSQR